MLSEKRSPEEKQKTGIHFFRDDYKFERIWNTPEKYIEKLAEYACVLSPDFSPYGDMPMATQIFNHYRKHWVAVYMQECGLTVIPTIRASTDERSFDWYLDGEPKHSIVAISTMWVKENSENFPIWEREYQTMVDILCPQKIFIYGDIPNNVTHKNVKRIESFQRKGGVINDDETIQTALNMSMRFIPAIISFSRSANTGGNSTTYQQKKLRYTRPLTNSPKTKLWQRS